MRQNSNQPQADTIAYETSLLDADRAAAVEQLIMGEAPRLTVTRLQRRLRHLVMAADPEAARRRAEKARREG